MSEETVVTAARRVVRFFNIDMNKGGLITEETQQAVETLDKMVRSADRMAARAQDVKDAADQKQLRLPGVDT
jgi:hypothetical protein